MKVTAIAPSNIAFIKYWGKKDAALRLPTHDNISMNLSNLLTTTTVHFDQIYKKDDIVIDGEQKEKDIAKVIAHLERIRKKANIKSYAKVLSKNNFPSSTGLSSSASGFAALTLAGTVSAGLTLTEKNLSILARLGSGSACRSIPSGIVEWKEGIDSDSSYAVSLFSESHWDIIDVVAVMSNEKKSVPTTEGHERAQSSIFYETRLKKIKKKIEICKQYIKKKQFNKFGELIEAEALEMHAVMITSHPPLLYWLPTTLILMKRVMQWRNEGLACYFTINTGQDIHIICQKKDEKIMLNKLHSMNEIRKVIVNYPAEGAHITDNHLF